VVKFTENHLLIQADGCARRLEGIFTVAAIMDAKLFKHFNSSRPPAGDLPDGLSGVDHVLHPFPISFPAFTALFMRNIGTSTEEICSCQVDDFVAAPVENGTNHVEIEVDDLIQLEGGTHR
jgi:hypothetical protein